MPNWAIACVVVLLVVIGGQVLLTAMAVRDATPAQRAAILNALEDSGLVMHFIVRAFRR